MKYDNELWKVENVEDWMETLFRSIPDLIIFKDGAGRWIFASDYTLSLFRLEDYPYMGKTSTELSHITPNDSYRAILRSRERAEEEAWQARKLTRSEVEFPLLDGRSIILDVLICPIFGSDGQRRALVVIGRDITERKIAEEQAFQLAYYDQLTKLPNRFRFEQELENRIIVSQALDQSFVLMFIDIDRFKYITNTLGPAVGDQLIFQISERINQCLQKDHFLARLVGDEFAVLIPNVFGPEIPSRIAGRIIASFESPFPVSHYELFVTATIGLCCFPQDGLDVQTLMKHADVALTLAKEKGKNCFLFFNPKMDVASFKLFSLENSLNKAMSSEQFEIYYQPKIEISTNRIIGAEALIRWNHPEWGLTSPREFIPLAEETGLINPIGEWVIQTVCNQIKAWQDAGLKIVPVSVNCTAKQFMHKDFVTNIKRVLDETGIDPKYLEIEITEATLIENEELVIDIIHTLRELGLQVSLDDFGTGYSALSYLMQFDVNAIKIDRSFINEIGTNQKVTLIVKGIIQLVKSLDLVVVAEGVETKEQLRFLKEQQCDQLQGYLYCRPVQDAEFEQWLGKEQILLSEDPEEEEVRCENRRKYYRIALTYPLLAEMTITMFMGKKVSLGNTEILIWDIGLGGIGFASNVKMPVRPDMTLRVRTMILGEILDFTGRIVWSREVEEESYRYGMEFCIEEKEREAIDKVLNIFSVKLRQSPVLPDCQFIMSETNSYLKKGPQEDYQVI